MHKYKSLKTIPKKYLGQHFLVNVGIQQKIIDSCQFLPTDIVLEVGPGEGVLTKYIIPKVKEVFAIEKDKSLAQSLSREYQDTNLVVIHDDILKFSLDKFVFPVKLVGNLPYYISTPIIEKIIEHRDIFNDVYIMVQREYAQRMVAKPNNKDYGSLSLFVQLFCEPRILFKISPGSFRPAPKVESCFIHLKMFKEPRFVVKDRQLLQDMIRGAFQQRRKTIENSLNPWIPKESWESFDKPLKALSKLRAENLSLQDYVRLTEKMTKDAIL
jgi:16S rRNA (adenine1518-N6/adenine1519-N6)-dimethyltransferase